MNTNVSTGLTHTLIHEIPGNMTVPHLIPEAAEFQAMPRVLATGYMVGLMEWACIQTMNPWIDWPREQSVGIGLNITHEAPTPPGLTVTIKVKLDKVEGRKWTFLVKADDGQEIIGQGIHERCIIDFERFSARARAKAEKIPIEKER